MKRILVLFTVILCVFGLSSAALAEGFKLDFDLTTNSPNESYRDYSVGFLSADGSWSTGQFVLGGSLALSCYRDPSFTSVEDGLISIWGVYAGYKFLDGDVFDLTGLGGYYLLKQDYTNSMGGFSVTWQDSGFGLGLRAGVNLAPVSLSFTYLMGLGGSSEVDTSPWGVASSSDPGFNLLEAKIGYALSDAWILYLTYRKYDFVGVDFLLLPGPQAVFSGGANVGFEGFGIGASYSF